MRRTVGILFGLGSHVVFVVTVWQLYWFLADTASNGPPGSLWIDFVLAAVFSIIHSALLLPGIRRRLERFIPSSHYGCFFSLMTCLSLLVTFRLWRTSPVLLWQLSGWPRTCMEGAFLASWGLLFYSLYLSGLGYQTGWTPWWLWMLRRPLTRRRFEPRSLYRWLRHPVYFSFLGLIWFTPTMSADHAVLTAGWTVYIFVGSYLKDRRLTYYLGDVYRRYQSQVIGFPGMLFGPLARLPLDNMPRQPMDTNCVATS